MAQASFTWMRWTFILLGNAIALRFVYLIETDYDKNILLRNMAEERDRPSNFIAKEYLPPLSEFNKITQEVYTHDICQKDSTATTQKEFELSQWNDKTSGGLDDKDRIMLAKYYGSANSIFEWGLGESTYMAGYFNVSRYAGIDSDAEWVSNARDKVRWNMLMLGFVLLFFLILVLNRSPQ